MGEIHDESCPDQWKYVLTELNPADYGSRGMNVSKMKNSQQWSFRLEFLTKSKDVWPEEKIEREPNAETYKVELQELVQHLDQDKIQRMTSNNEIHWHLNPPLVPHFGGVFERMIKSAKRAINAILRHPDVKDEELLTVFTGVKSLLNSRPLMATSNDPNDDPILTPNHFLIGHMGGELAPETVDMLAF